MQPSDYRVSSVLFPSPNRFFNPLGVFHRENHDAILGLVDDLRYLDLQLLKLTLAEIALESGVLNPVQVSLHYVIHLGQAPNLNIVRDDHMHGRSPLALEA